MGYKIYSTIKVYYFPPDIVIEMLYYLAAKKLGVSY